MTNEAPNLYDNAPDELLVQTILELEEESKEAAGRLKRAKNTLIDRKQAEIAEALQKKPEPFGAVSQVIGDKKITFTTPKSADWDQEKLESLFKQIEADGADPKEYIKVEFKVSEEAYKNWPSNIKEYFEPARSVKPGNVSVKITPAKE